MSTDENDFEHTTNIVENLDVVTPNMFDRCFYPSDTTLSQTLDSFFRVCRKNGIVCEPSKKTKYDFKKREKPVFIQVRRIIDTKHKYLDSDVLFVFKDTVLFPEVNPNTNNYWTWCAMKLKKILKEQPYSLKGLVRVSFFHDYTDEKNFGKNLAHILVNMDSLFQPHKEYKLWTN